MITFELKHIPGAFARYLRGVRAARPTSISNNKV
jgi:hypothetical protein